MLALVDCNNFYASCETVFDLSLRNKPLVILSNNDGCVIARSKEAKQLGIAMGQPAFEIQHLINAKQLFVRSSNFPLYADMSNRVMQTLAHFAKDIEIYSIDEAFLHLKDENIGYKIRSTVKKWTGIPISVGIAPTKTLAKIANRFAKKHDSGVKVLTKAEEIDRVLQETKPEDIWGIGKRLAKRLRRLQIFSAFQLKNSDDIMIRKLLGVIGYKTVLELRGTSCIPFEENHPPKKSVTCSRSFGSVITDLQPLQEAVASFAARGVKKLRDDKLFATYLSVFLATSPFAEKPYSNHAGICLPMASSFTPEIIHFAKQCLEKIYQPNFLYKRAGILLSGLVSKPCQMNFFQKDTDRKRKEKIMQVVDEVNTSYDKAAIFFGAQGIENKWKSCRKNVSPRYTTCWDELLKVR